MKITESQLIALLQIGVDSLRAADDAGLIFSFDHTIRAAIVGKVMNQQTDTLEAIEEPPK